MLSPSNHYEKYRRLIWYESHLFSRKTGLDVEELFSEGNIVYLTTYEYYLDTPDVEFSTILVRRIRQRFFKVQENNIKEKASIIFQDVEWFNNKAPSSDCIGIRSIDFNDRIETELSEEARDIVKFVLRMPRILAKKVPYMDKRQLRGEIARLSIRLLSICSTNTWAAFREIKAFVGTI